MNPAPAWAEAPAVDNGAIIWCTTDPAVITDEEGREIDVSLGCEDRIEADETGTRLLRSDPQITVTELGTLNLPEARALGEAILRLCQRAEETPARLSHPTSR